MLEFVVPSVVDGTGTVTIYGSLQVPEGYAPSGVGDTGSGSFVDFDIRVTTAGGNMEDLDFWAVDHPILRAVRVNDYEYNGSVAVQLGIAGAGRSIYVRYHNFEQFGSGGKAASIYNVTLDALPARNLTVSKQTKRGRFV